ncbi:MAG: LysR family transcriptional regulator [Sandaracinaceae bacterium]|nr:LysR family transcriptional regulator [Sandaracinaceae bacterium]
MIAPGPRAPRAPRSRSRRRRGARARRRAILVDHDPGSGRDPRPKWPLRVLPVQLSSRPMKTRPVSWDDLRFLLAVHRDRSFFAAGRSLGVAASTVARRVEAMERSLGRALVHRSNDGTRLDREALRLVVLAEELELGLASLVRDGRETEVSGTVRVSLSEGFVRPLVPLLARLHAKHPALRVEVISEARIADLARGEAEIGIRIVRSASAPIVSKLLGRASTGLFASRDYVERRLPSAKLSRDVAGTHDWVGLDASLERLPQEQWTRAYGASRFTFRSNSVFAVEQAVVSGMGIGLLGVVQASSLAGLVELDAAATPPPVEVFLAFRRDARKTSRVRVVAREIEADARRLLR